MAGSLPAGPRAVLVTRPASDSADALCAAVAAAGYKAYHQPLLGVQPLQQVLAPQRQMLLDLAEYEHIIFISTNAVRLGMVWIEDYWPQLPVGLHWYAIGGATRASLQRYGVSAITAAGDMSSEALLAVTQLQNVSGQRVLIVKGEGGRDTLSTALLQRGARVDELACYRRYCPTVAPGELARKLTESAIDVILISSGEGLANLQVLLSPAETSKFKHIQLIVPSKRVAFMALEAGFEHVVTAANASDEAMLLALKELSRSSGE